MATKTAAKKAPAKKAPAKTTSMKQVLDLKGTPKNAAPKVVTRQIPKLYKIVVTHTDLNAMVEHTATLLISQAKYEKLVFEGKDRGLHGADLITLPGVPGEFKNINTTRSTDDESIVRYQWSKLINASGAHYTSTTWIKRRMSELLEYGFMVHSAAS
jgi:hypothetical protein